MQIYKFSNGQIEKFYKNGNKKIYFPDESVKYIVQDSHEQVFYPDGTVQKMVLDTNIVTIEHPNGTKVN